MKGKIKTLYLSKVFEDSAQKKAFIAEMNLRFNVTKSLMETLKTEIENPGTNKEIEAKSIYCAFTLMMHLDRFIDEMRIIIKEKEDGDSIQ